MSHAKIIATRISEKLEERDFDKTIVTIGCDSTNVDTGWKGGTMAQLEKLLGRKLVWFVCDLHTNELPLRHLIIDLDEKTSSNNKWSGPLGQTLDDATELEIEHNIVNIYSSPLPVMPENVSKTLYTDQFYAHLIHKAIRTGQMSLRLTLLEIGLLAPEFQYCLFVRLVSEHIFSWA